MKHTKDLKKHIAFCITTLGIGGAEDIIYRLANDSTRKFYVHLFLLQRCLEDVNKINALDKNIEVISFFKHAHANTSYQYKLKNILGYALSPFIAIYFLILMRRRRIDIIHVNLAQFSLYAIYWAGFVASFKNKPKLIHTFHTNFHLLKPWHKTIFIFSWQFADKVILEIDKDELKKAAKYVGTDRLAFISFAVSSNREYSKLPHLQNKIIGSLARLRIFEKKYDLILESLYILKSKDFDFKYIIGGTGPDKEFIENKIQELGLQNHVTMFGNVSDLTNFFCLLDIFIVATVGNEVGIAGLQALNANLPLVGIDTKNESNKVNLLGDMYVANNSLELADFLEKMLTIEDLSVYLGKVKRERSDYLSEKKMFSAYRALFNSY